MKMVPAFPLWKLLLGLIALFAATADADEVLFNGRNLDGWRGDPRLWRVEDGVLVGQTDASERRIEKNSFLTWEGGDLGDFELTLEVRITGQNNSGVQYRSRLVDAENFAVQGYQMDLHPKQEYNAMLYEEGGRGIVCLRGQSVRIDKQGNRKIQPLENRVPETNLAEWAEYRLVAKGPTVTHWVNGQLAAQITDHEVGKFSRTGILALQLHAGPPMRAEFKDIVLKRLAADEGNKPAEETSTSPDNTRAEWIWSREQPIDNEEVFFQRTIESPENVSKAVLLVSCDNHHELFLDGKSIGQSGQWETPSLYDVSGVFADPGHHTLEARARNQNGPAGFALRLELTLTSGEKKVVVSDEKWTWSPKRHDRTGKPVVTIGPMGTEPWGHVFAGWAETVSQVAKDVTAEYQTLPGFKLEQLYEVPKTEGSWVAMTVDDRGRLIASDQYGGLFRITPAPIGEPDAVTQVEPLNLPITGAQGLLWAHDALYAVVSIGDMGVFRITDSDGDGELDQVKNIKPLEGAGEHGPHGLVLSPNEKWIYLVSGNHTKPPAFDQSLVPEVWGEDQLLPRRPDARGHARNIMAPGGWVARFTPEGDHWEFVSSGFRNAYDIAFNEHGDLFTYDSDMEWDMGTPWYRPTRICHITSGSEFGWRHGTGKWPVYYEDSLPPLLDIGPGSPTGVVAGKGLRFPARYQRAIYMLDWTYAAIYAVHLTPEGATYRAETEEFVGGTGLPMTDAVVGMDGALYFSVGGRRTNSALFRVRYTGNESTAAVARPVSVAPKTQKLAQLRRELEALHKQPDPAALDKIWSSLDHEDRFIRFAARIALEHLPLASWKDRLQGTNTHWQSILGAIALARTGAASDQSLGLTVLDRIDPAALTDQRHLNLLRAYGLLFARHGEPDDRRRAELIQRFSPLYPAKSDDLNRELCRLLVYLKSPDVLPKTLELMAAAPPSEAPPWARLAARNQKYGSPVSKMIENMPSAQNLFYAYCLRTLEGPWTPGQRRQFFTWLSDAARKSGGNSYQGFIADLREETLERATAQERKMIARWDLTPSGNTFANLPSVEGPGRAWSVDEAVAAAEKGLVNRDLARGKQMFQATLCASCHRFAGEGGGTGPDLTAVGNRFTVADLMEAIIKPNKEVSDQYQFELITLKDGSAFTGRIVDEQDGVLTVATNPFNLIQTRTLERETVEKIAPSPVSPMPGGLINRLNEDELRDLLAYLMRRE